MDTSSQTKLRHVVLEDEERFRGPLRVTLEEWEDAMNCNLGTDTKIFRYPAFTMQQDLIFTGDWDYCEVIEIALAPWMERPLYREFGPHKSDGLARQKALQFLIDHRAIEIIQR